MDRNSKVRVQEPHMAKLETIEGIGPIYAQKLREAGISTVEALLKAGATPGGRKKLHETTGIGGEFILDWVNRADLMRIRGIGEEYSDLLEKAGVNTVVQLAQRNSENLHQRLTEVSAETRLVRRPPSHTMVDQWIQQAKDLPRIVSY
jgi:predicted flap endonuclease-1-like 5' DNA nuclease